VTIATLPDKTEASISSSPSVPLPGQGGYVRREGNKGIAVFQKSLGIIWVRYIFSAPFLLIVFSGNRIRNQYYKAGCTIVMHKGGK
jgi:hypothetical protein